MKTMSLVIVGSGICIALPLVSCSTNDNNPPPHNPPITVVSTIDGQHWQGWISGTLGYDINETNHTITYTNRSNNYAASNLVIPDTVIDQDGKTYTVISVGVAFQNCSSLAGILVIGDSINSIVDNAFNGCSNLNGSLTIGSGVTSIGNNAFCDCLFSGRLDIPNSVVGIGNSAFRGCCGFSSIIANFAGEPSIGASAFGNFNSSGTVNNLNPSYSRTNLLSLLKSNGNLPVNWTIAPYKMDGTDWEGYTSGNITCTPINSTTARISEQSNYVANNLIIPDQVTNGTNTYSLTAIGDNTFKNCSNITGSLTIGNDITTIGIQSFQNCSGLNSGLAIGNSVVTIGNSAFWNCSNISQHNLIIPNSVHTIESSAFNGCSSLTGNLTIGVHVVSIGGSAFKDCSSLTGNLVIPNTVITIGGDAFRNCSGFNGTLTISNGVNAINAGAFQDCSGFVGSLTIPNSVTNIGNDAFRNCSGFNGGLTISNSVSIINRSIFSGCTGFIGSLTIPSGVTVIQQQAFKDCSSFSSVIGNFEEEPIIENEAFIGFNAGGGTINNLNPSYSRTNLLNLLKSNGNLPANWTIAPYKMDGTDWEGYTSGNITCTPIDSTTVKISSQSGYSANNLVIPDTVVDASGNTYAVGAIDNGVFMNDVYLSGSLTIGNNIATIGHNAFNGCSLLTGELAIGNHVVSIGEMAFAGCVDLIGNLVIPNSVTTILHGAFNGCRSFDTIIIGSGVNDIRYDAFRYCNGVQTITGYLNSSPAIGSNSFNIVFPYGTVANNPSTGYTYNSSDLLNDLVQNGGLPSTWII